MRSAPPILLAALLLTAVAFFVARLVGDRGPDLAAHAVEDERAHHGAASAAERIEHGSDAQRELAAGATTPSTPSAASEDDDEQRSLAPENELRGLVTDARGAGIAGCEVILLAPAADPFAGERRAIDADAPRVTTAQDGRFAFVGIPPGDGFELFVRHPEYAPALAAGVRVRERGICEEPPIVLRRGKRLSGRVVDELGAPIADARLVLEGAWSPARAEPSFDALSATTGPDGEYEIAGIADGRRSLSARAAGFGTQTMPDGILFEDRIGTAYERDFRLQRAAPVSGRVVASEGAPIAGALVLAQDRRNARVAAHGSARSAVDGSFALADLQPGVYVLSVDAEGYARALVRELAPPAERVEVVLDRLPALHGRVVAAGDGRAIESFALRLRAEALPGTASAPQGPARSFEAARDGEFVLRGLYEGTFQVEASAPGFAPGFSASFRCDGRRDVLGIVVELERGAAIRGRVVDEAGEPIAGAMVACGDDELDGDALLVAMGDELPTLATARTARCDHEGRFELHNLHPHRYRLNARAADRAPSVVRGLELFEGDLLELAPVVLLPAATLRGRLLDAHGRPVAGGRVLLRALDGANAQERRREKSGAQGEYAFADLAPGRYGLAGGPPIAASELEGDPLAWYAGADGERVIELFAGVELALDVELDGWSPPVEPPEPPPAGNVSGRVLDASGAPLAGISIELAPRDREAPAERSKSEAGGEFVFVRVEPGRYRLRIAERDDAGVEIVVEADRWTQQDLSAP